MTQNKAEKDMGNDIRSLPAEESKALKPGENHYRAYVGPPGEYDVMGATQFRLLATLGLCEHHQFLDVGCGSLRAGRLFISYLLPGRYFGIEPNQWLVDDAFKYELGSDLRQIKKPHFLDRSDFDASSFGMEFDFIVAQSVLSHTGYDLTQQALAAFRKVMHSKTQALVTFKHVNEIRKETRVNGWIYPGTAAYEPATVRELINAAGMHCQALPWFHPRQTWYRIVLDKDFFLREEDLSMLSGRTIAQTSE